ncbi:MAG: hypothetical protein ACO3F5_02370 [Gemmatimonadaceae bacterium]
MRLASTPLAVFLAAILLVQRTEAQSCTTQTISTGQSRSCQTAITVSGNNATGFRAPTLMELTVTPATWSTTPTIADLEAGKTPPQTMTLEVRANRTWIVTASGNATFSASGSLARTDKPVSHVRWSTVNSGSGTGLSTASATIASGSAGAATGSNVKTLVWWTTLSWTGDPPGSYSMPITLTLTTP